MSWDYAHKVFDNYDINYWEFILNFHKSFFVKCWNLLVILKSMFNNIISRRLNDISYYPDFLANICFESCKIQQVWPYFMIFNNIRWDPSNLECLRRFGHSNRQMSIRKFSQLTINWPLGNYTKIHLTLLKHYQVLNNFNCCLRAECLFWKSAK